MDHHGQYISVYPNINLPTTSGFHYLQTHVLFFKDPFNLVIHGDPGFENIWMTEEWELPLGCSAELVPKAAHSWKIAVDTATFKIMNSARTKSFKMLSKN